MGCGCNKNRNVTKPTSVSTTQQENLTGKFVLDQSNRKLLIIEPIFDSYRDIIGYVTKDESQNTIRIFTKNITEVLE